MTVHLVYVKGFSRATPTAITNELAERLRRHVRVKTYDYDDGGIIHPQPGDILIGHHHPDPTTLMARSVKAAGWRTKILMAPLAHSEKFLGWHTIGLAPIIERVDHFLAICGRYWFDTLPNSLVSHWGYKIRQLDLAVNRDHFPLLRRRWNTPGQRRFLYVGHTDACKGVDYLSALADANPHLHIAWIGTGTMPSLRVHPLGYHPLTDEATRKTLRHYDFLLHCGRSDANPTTILEAASLGLVPICTPQSGYYREDWVVNVPLDSVGPASAILERLNFAGESELDEWQRRGQAALRGHYNWDRFTRDVLACIDSPAPGEPDDPAWLQRKTLNLRRLDELGRHWSLRPSWAGEAKHGVQKWRRRAQRRIKGCRENNRLLGFLLDPLRAHRQRRRRRTQ